MPAKEKHPHNIPEIIPLVYGCPKMTAPDSGLMNREDSWYILFYNKAGRTSMRSLHTNDLDVAKGLRDRIFKAARKAGRGGQSKLERMATEVLANPESMQGFKFKVLMGGNTEHHSIEEAVAVRAQRAKAILARRKMA